MGADDSADRRENYPVEGPLNSSDSDLCGAFSSDELSEAVKLINMDSAPGPDGFTPKLIKDLFSFRAFFSYFLIFVNFCFANAWIPLAWRCAEIFILYKGKGDPFCSDSYRGIALCCILDFALYFNPVDQEPYFFFKMKNF
jgi:hypothetical protein